MKVVVKAAVTSPAKDVSSAAGVLATLAAEWQAGACQQQCPEEEEEEELPWKLRSVIKTK